MEEYKKFFEDYEISKLGNCRKKLKNGTYKELKGSINNRGYRYIQLSRDKKRINFLFHHQVAYFFIGERPENLVIDHIDRNKLNNKVENLRYITHTDNVRNCDKYREDIKETGEEREKKINKLWRLKIIEEEKFKCEICNKCFQAPGKLKRHENGHLHKLKYESFLKHGENWRDYYLNDNKERYNENRRKKKN